MSREKLTLLTTKTMRLDDTPAGTGNEGVRWEDVSGSLSKLPDHISAYAKLCMSADTIDLRDFNKCYEAVLLMAHCLKMLDNVTVDKLRKACRLALIEQIQGKSHNCKFCNGTGKAFTNNAFHDCLECNGSGKRRVTDEFIGVSIGYNDGSNYRRLFKPKYLRICQEISVNWDRAIDDCLRGVR